MHPIPIKSWQPVAPIGRPQVVALHGSASHRGQWRPLVEALSPQFDVSTPALPGYGGQCSDARKAAPALADDAIELARIAQDASAPIHIVAHSYSAAVAVRFALDQPQTVASLTLIEPVLFHLLRSGRALDRAHDAEISRIAMAMNVAHRIGMASFGMSRFVDYCNGAGTWQTMKAPRRAALASQISQVARHFRTVFGESWSAAACRRIPCPTLIIAGQKSPGPIRRVAQILFEAMPQARLRTIPGVGHMAPVTHPETVNRLIAQALAAELSDSEPSNIRAAA